MNKAKAIALPIEYCCLLAAACFSLLYLYIAVPSLVYPFQLEWIEGQSVDTIARAHQGLPIYAAPTLEYTALLYTPLYYYISSAVAWLTGMDFIAGRSVSFLASLGIASVFWRWIHKEGGTWQHACVAIGLFAASYKLSGRWFDLARVDTTALYLLCEGLYRLRFASAYSQSIIAGVLLSAAYFTKQTTLGMSLAMLSLAVTLKPWQGLCAAGAALIVFIIGNAYLEYSTDGWYSFFTLRVPMGHNSDEAKWVSFWRTDVIAQQVWVLCAALCAPLLFLKQHKKHALIYATLLAATLASIFISRLHRYGYVNNLMPMHAVFALMSGIALAKSPQLWRSGLYLILIAQFYNLIYDPKPFIPEVSGVEKGHKFLQEMARYKGEIFAPDIQFISNRIGKKSYSYGMGSYDVFRARLKGEDEKVKDQLASQMQTAIAQAKFDVIIPGRMVHYNLPNLHKYYKIGKQIDYPEGYALDSRHIRKAVIFVPK